MEEKKAEAKKGTPRMRTIPQAYREIPSISIKSKKLINVDLLLDYLSCYNQYAIQAKWS